MRDERPEKLLSGHRHAFLPGIKLDLTPAPALRPEFSFSRLLLLMLLNLTAAFSLTLNPLECPLLVRSLSVGPANVVLRDPPDTLL